MKGYPELILKLANEFSKLPGVGRKSAIRIALFIAQDKGNTLKELSSLIDKTFTNIKECKICFNMTETDTCDICEDKKRDSKIICVVDSIKDLYAIERTRDFEGLYHVLGGNISPLDGIGPNDIRIPELLSRVENNEIEEVILANSPTVEGEATSIYISKLLNSKGVKVTRIAHGVPIGADLDYADEVTLSKSLERRQSY